MNWNVGKMGEDAAVHFLEREGYRILERNWRYRHKEIDIIGMDGDVVVIVEVKTRINGDDRPDELLDYKKRRNLAQAGAAYLKHKELDKEIRFDLIIVSGESQEVTHIKEAIQLFNL